MARVTSNVKQSKCKITYDRNRGVDIDFGQRIIFEYEGELYTGYCQGWKLVDDEPVIKTDMLDKHFHRLDLPISKVWYVRDRRDDRISELEKENRELASALDFIHDMAYEDLRTAHETTSTWTIEAVAAKALGLSDEQRDLGVTADDKLVELMTYVAQKCDAEVAEMWKTWTKDSEV